MEGEHRHDRDGTKTFDVGPEAVRIRFRHNGFRADFLRGTINQRGHAKPPLRADEGVGHRHVDGDVVVSGGIS